MAKRSFSKYIVVLLIGMFCTPAISAQDTSAQNLKLVLLQADRINNAAPDYKKFKAKLEEGIKDLLVDSKVPIPKNQKEAAGKSLQDCNNFTCTYTIGYATGMMFNAKIKCTLTFTDCHKKDVYVVSESKMTGAVANADVYLKVFAKLISPGLIKHLVVAQ